MDAGIKKALSLVDGGVKPIELFTKCIEPTLANIGEKFSRLEIFLPEMIGSADVVKAVQSVLRPIMGANHASAVKGKVVIGTVQRDIHDKAKDIVVFLLDINGFEVYDLGVDVPTHVFLDKVIETQAEIVGLSGFLTLALDPMQKTIDLFIEKGLKDKVKIMIGGGPIDEHARKYTGADAWGKDAMEAVHLAKNWTISD